MIASCFLFKHLKYHPKYEVYNAQIKLDNREHQVLQIKSNPHFAGELPRKLTITAFHMLLHPCSPNQLPATFFFSVFSIIMHFSFTPLFTPPLKPPLKPLVDGFNPSEKYESQLG